MAISSPAATTTDTTHRHVAARRRIATPSVRSSRTFCDRTGQLPRPRWLSVVRTCDDASEPSGRSGRPGRVPVAQAGRRRLVADEALVEAELEQEASASPTIGPGARPSDRASRRHRRARDAARPAPRPRPARRCGPRARPCDVTAWPPCGVAGGAVAAGEHVQLGEQIAGVAHVSPDRGVAPPHLVGVEAQVEGDELDDGGDVGRRVAQAPPSACASSGRRPHRGGGTSCPCPAGGRGYAACPHRGTALPVGPGGSRRPGRRRSPRGGGRCR